MQPLYPDETPPLIRFNKLLWKFIKISKEEVDLDDFMNFTILKKNYLASSPMPRCSSY